MTHRDGSRKKRKSFPLLPTVLPGRPLPGWPTGLPLPRPRVGPWLSPLLIWKTTIHHRYCLGAGISTSSIIPPTRIPSGSWPIPTETWPEPHVQLPALPPWGPSTMMVHAVQRTFVVRDFAGITPNSVPCWLIHRLMAQWLPSGCWMPTPGAIHSSGRLIPAILREQP